MLRGMHTATRNWLGRLITGLLLGLIAVSFAVWGIGDIFRGFGQSTVAKIGGTEIGLEQFRQNYNERLQQLIRQVGRPIPPDQARALGLPRQMLGQMLAEAAVDENVRSLGLNLPNDVIAQRIQNDPSFRGFNGQFDRARFEALIRQAGYTESRYVTEQRKQLLRQQIVRSLVSDLSAPETAIDAQNRYLNELRSLDYFVLGSEQAGDIPEPAPEVLSKYFEERKNLFRAPEFRKVDLVVLSPETVAKTMEISDADVQKAFEADRARYVTPERRELQQIVFPNEEEARAGAQKLAQGTTFEQLAAERGLKDGDFNLGLVSKSQVLDPAVAQAAFTLQSGQVSEPVKGRFGSVLVRAGKIEAEVARSISDVSADIKRDLATERARREVRALYDKMEDERLAGGAIAELAKKVGLTVRTIDAMDRAGRGPEGNAIPDLPAGANLPSAAFASEPGVENEPIQLPNGGGYVWYEVLSITPSRERPLDEVRDRVVERWRNDQITAKLKEKAKEAVEKLKTSSISETASAFGAKPQFIASLRRDRTQGNFPSNALEAVFQTPKDSVGSSEGDDPSQWIVFRVTGVTVPQVAAGSPDAQRLQANLANAYSEDLIAQYITSVQTELGATINEAALNQVIGGSTN